MQLHNWGKIYSELSILNQNQLRTKIEKEKDLIVFTAYVLKIVKYNISNEGILNRIKLLMSKADNFIIRQININDIYSKKIKFIFNL